MVYNPIFEEEEKRDKELMELRKAIKLRAGKDQVKDLAGKFSHFVTKHPIFTVAALSAFMLGDNKAKKFL